MGQDARPFIKQLNELIGLDLDAVHAYSAAIHRLTSPTLRDQLGACRDEHRRHVRDLSDLVVTMGGSPRTRPHVRGVLYEALTAVSSMLGDDAGLRALRATEEATTHAYRTALDDLWPQRARSILERLYEDERRHLGMVLDAVRDHSAVPADHM